MAVWQANIDPDHFFHFNRFGRWNYYPTFALSSLFASVHLKKNPKQKPIFPICCCCCTLQEITYLYQQLLHDYISSHNPPWQMHTHPTHPDCISPWANPSFDLGSSGPCLLCVLYSEANMEQDGRLLFERWEWGDKVKKKKWIEARVERLQGFIFRRQSLLVNFLCLAWRTLHFALLPHLPHPDWGIKTLKPSTEVASLRFFDWHSGCSCRFIGF